MAVTQRNAAGTFWDGLSADVKPTVAGTAFFYETDTRVLLYYTGATWQTAGTTNHGQLNNLGVDDHTQYLLINGTRAMTGNLNVGSNSSINVNSERYVVRASEIGAPTEGEVWYNNTTAPARRLRMRDNLTTKFLAFYDDDISQFVGSITGPQHGVFATGDRHTDYFLANGTRDLAGNLIPDVASTRSLGSSTRYFNTVYVRFGSVGTPSITFQDDNDTGIASPGALNTFDLIGGGLTQLRITDPASGNVGILVRQNVGGVFTLVQVSMGAVDSGGAGFKLLRVPN